MKYYQFEEKRELLSKTILEDQNAELIWQAANHTTLKTYYKDDYVYFQGQKSDAIYLIKDGEILLTVRIKEGKNNSNKEKGLLYLANNESFGLLEFLNNSETRVTSARVTRNSDIYSIEYSKLISLFEDICPTKISSLNKLRNLALEERLDPYMPKVRQIYSLSPKQMEKNPPIRITQKYEMKLMKILQEHQEFAIKFRDPKTQKASNILIRKKLRDEFQLREEPMPLNYPHRSLSIRDSYIKQTYVPIEHSVSIKSLHTNEQSPGYEQVKSKKKQRRVNSLYWISKRKSDSMVLPVIK